MMDQQTNPASDDDLWQVVEDRNGTFDGDFVYAVRSTGIFCRPSCPSRRPQRRQVRFFPLPELAAQAGFRACKRCRPEDAEPRNPSVDIARRVCRLLAEEGEGLPTLKDLGLAVGVSPYHLQRVFKRIVGITPRQYAEALRLGRIKEELRNGEPVAQALYGAGYGSPSRLYEKAPGQFGMTPASYAKGGRGARIAYALGDSSLGRVLVAATDKGICAVSLGDRDRQLTDELHRDFPAAEIIKEDGALSEWVEAVLRLLNGEEPHVDLPLDVQATAFQRQVWQRLQAIPFGQTRSYGDIATDLGKPGSARAVGQACGANPVAVLIPCHRAVGQGGKVTGYRWGTDRKRKILEREKETP